MIPNLPAVVNEALSLMFNAAQIQQVDFYASKPSAWWGVSVKIGSTGGLGALLGAFNFIFQELGFPSLSSFTPRFSIAGKLSGNGLPVAVGLDYKTGSGSATKVRAASVADFWGLYRASGQLSENTSHQSSPLPKCSGCFSVKGTATAPLGNAWAERA